MRGRDAMVAQEGENLGDVEVKASEEKERMT